MQIGQKLWRYAARGWRVYYLEHVPGILKYALQTHKSERGKNEGYRNCSKP
jgi:hypothetical protein